MSRSSFCPVTCELEQSVDVEVSLEMPLDRAVLSFEWRFDRVSDRRTRITQRITLSGDNAGAYATDVRDGFGATLADGMHRLAGAMAAAAHSAASGSQN